MKLSELIDRLQQHAQAAGDHDPEVRIAYQPNYPLAADVDAVTAISGEDEGKRPDRTIWLAAASSVGYDENPYAPRQAWDGDEVSLAEEEAQ